MDCSPPGSSVHGDSRGKNTGVGCHALLQGIFLTQGWNSGLLHCRQILYHLSHQEALYHTKPSKFQTSTSPPTSFPPPLLPPSSHEEWNLEPHL